MVRISLSLLLTGALVFILSCGGNSKEKDAQVDSLQSDTRAVPDEPFGSACDNPGEQCKVKDSVLGYTLWCVSLTKGTSGKGFCTRQCSDKGGECSYVPNGMMADCFVEAVAASDAGPGTKYCGFYCKSTKGQWNCPPKLSCPDSKADTLICVQ